MSDTVKPPVDGNSVSATLRFRGVHLYLNVLFLIFFALKQSHLVTWSWWDVFSPLLVRLGIYIFAYVVIGIGFVVVARLKAKEAAKK